MQPSSLEFIEPMKILDHQPDGNFKPGTGSITSKQTTITTNLSSSRKGLHLPKLLDRLLDKLLVSEIFQPHWTSVSILWERSTCASEYLEVLQKVLPLLQTRFLEQQALISRYQSESETASVQAQRHQVYIDQETARGNLSVEARRKYQGDTITYEKTRAKIELHLHHHCNIGRLSNDIVKLIEELRSLLEKAIAIENGSIGAHGDTTVHGTQKTRCTQVHHQGVAHDLKRDDIQLLSPYDARDASAAIAEVSVCCRVIGRIVDKLLDAENRELLQVDLKLQGWECIDDISEDAFRTFTGQSTSSIVH